MCLYCVYYQNKKIFLIDFKRRYVIFLVKVYTKCKNAIFIKCDGGDLLETNHMARLTTYH